MDEESTSNHMLYAKEHLIQKEIQRLIVKYHAPGTPQKARVAIIFADNVNFKPRMIKRYKEGNYILVRGKLPEEHITISSTYATNMGESSNIKQILILNFK